MTMNLKQKMSKVVTAAHPKIVTLGISFAIAAAAGIGLGAVGTTEQAFAASTLQKRYCFETIDPSLGFFLQCEPTMKECNQFRDQWLAQDPSAVQSRCYKDFAKVA
jgi:hypothetical protein